MLKSLFFALFWHLWLCWRASYFISDHLLLKNLLRTLKTSVKVKKVTKTVDFINSSQTLVCFHIHHKNSSLFLMHDLEKIKNLNRDRRISACPLGKQLTHFAFPGPLLARLRGCTHLVFGDQCLRTNTNWCCVHTLSTRYATVCIVTPFLPVRCHFET